MIEGSPTCFRYHGPVGNDDLKSPGSNTEPEPAHSLTDQNNELWNSKIMGYAERYLCKTGAIDIGG